MRNSNINNYEYEGFDINDNTQDQLIEYPSENSSNIEFEDLTVEQIQNIQRMEELLDEDSSTYIKTNKPKSAKSSEDLVDNYLKNPCDKTWKELQDFYWFGIHKFAYEYFKNWDIAYDMTIETFISAYNNIQTYDKTRAKFSTWIWTICRNNCLGKIKQDAKLPKIDNDISDMYDSEILSNATYNDIDNTYWKVSSGNKFEEISKADINIELYNLSLQEIERLNDLDKKIVKMKLIENKKIFEIAKELNMNESTIKNHLYKTKRNIAKCLKVKNKELYKMYVEANYA